ncbi:MAG: hypothetical protein QY316_04490 [Thermodesulfobacteriota bacterium]|nr:MAG: hypothetical protein QY316_04490 [Thermodesulfobacteriota bacterium]
MRYSTGQRRKSRLQGHRKRRRKPVEATEKPKEEPPVSLVDFKIIKQYQPLGDILDSMRIYGYRGGIEELLNRPWNPYGDSFQDWTANDIEMKEGK